MGVDIGGTNTRIALAYRGKLRDTFAHYTFATPAQEGPAYFLARLEEGVDHCLQQHGSKRSDIAGIGCTLPGITNAQTGTAIFVSNLKGWDGFELADHLQATYGVPVAVENDVNAAAIGEYRYGAGAGSSSLVYFTISTGIAVGIVLEGQVWRGANHAAGEIGFFVPAPEHLDKDWQPNGCLELNAGGIGLAKLWQQHHANNMKNPVSAIDVFEAAEKGNKDALDIVDQAANYLSQSVVAISTLLDPQQIVLSGSIAQHQTVFLKRFKAVVNFLLPHPPDIVLSLLHGEAPMTGALVIIEEKLALTTNGLYTGTGRLH